MKFKAVIFDVDGTLVETEELHRAAFNLTFKNWNLNWKWNKSIYTELLTVSGGIERLKYYQSQIFCKNEYLNDRDIRCLHEEKTYRYNQSLANTNLMLRPGVANLVARAQEKKIKLAIATATSRKNVDALVRNTWGTSVQAVFDVVATSEDVSNKKPSPEVYKIVLARLSIEARHCIAIEDSLNGLRSAKSAGLKTIIIPSVYTSNDNFSSADLVLHSLGDFELE